MTSCVSSPRHCKQRVSANILSCFTAFHEKNVFRSPENGTFFLRLARSLGCCPQRDHDLGLELVGLIGNFGIVEQLPLLVVEQLLNPILMFQGNLWRGSRKSLEGAK